LLATLMKSLVSYKRTQTLHSWLNSLIRNRRSKCALIACELGSPQLDPHRAPRFIHIHIRVSRPHFDV
jgi:hypothetical protein